MSLLVIFSLELTPASSLGKIGFSQIPTIPAKDPTPIRLYTLPEVQTESGFPLCQSYRQNQALYSARGRSAFCPFPMAQQVQSLPCDYEDQSLDIQNPQTKARCEVRHGGARLYS